MNMLILTANDGSGSNESQSATWAVAGLGAPRSRDDRFCDCSKLASYVGLTAT